MRCPTFSTTFSTATRPYEQVLSNDHSGVRGNGHAETGGSVKQLKSAKKTRRRSRRRRFRGVICAAALRALPEWDPTTSGQWKTLPALPENLAREEFDWRGRREPIVERADEERAGQGSLA